jgi:hypothetical protein
MCSLNQPRRGRHRLSGGLLIFFWLAANTSAAPDGEWVAFSPPPDHFVASAIDLRDLNEKYAGEHGFITARNSQFVHSANGQPVRFWAVNGPPHAIKDPADLRAVARALAKRGVNLVRIHGAIFDRNGEADLEKVRQAIDIVEAMKVEGIYSHASIYFPLWFRPKENLSWLKGYDGKKHPFAALMFNEEFQAKYRSWWEALLLTPGARGGRKLIDEPALMGAEIQNEDSFFFWTFSEQNLPGEQLSILEGQFGRWLGRKYGSLDAALLKWNGPKLKRDAPAEGRIGFRPLWNIANERTLRDQDTAEFLFEAQTKFYEEAREFLRGLGFKGLISASNWATASPEVFGPLEKLSYATGDFMDRHGYFSCHHKGDSSEWSIRDGHVYADRSALRFENLTPGQPRAFIHPVMDPHYAGKPSMISETTWTRPNRFRSEAPLYFATYGALQDSDAIVHFAHDGADWKVKPNFWMQPWTLMSPAMMGQFPAAALIYRKGLIAPGGLVAKVDLNRKELLALNGTPLPQDAALDELRLKDLPATAELKTGQRLDPMLHYVGRTKVNFTEGAPGVSLSMDPGRIDHAAQKVRSSHGQLQLDYGNGVLTINAPRAQGISGDLRSAGEITLADATIRSDLDLAHIILVSLDDRPIASSARLLLQVMSEEQTSGWKTETTGDGLKRILSVGRDPWMIKAMQGSVRLHRSDAPNLKVTALDANGAPFKEIGGAGEIRLLPDILYYLIEPGR